VVEEEREEERDDRADDEDDEGGVLEGLPHEQVEGLGRLGRDLVAAELRAPLAQVLGVLAVQTCSLADVRELGFIAWDGCWVFGRDRGVFGGLGRWRIIWKRLIWNMDR
jgi:hypothetical protein